MFPWLTAEITGASAAGVDINRMPSGSFEDLFGLFGYFELSELSAPSTVGSGSHWRLLMAENGGLEPHTMQVRTRFQRVPARLSGSFSSYIW